MITESIFKHDCDACRFLGHYYRRDIYFCNKGQDTLVFRYGDEPHEYESFGYSVQRTVLTGMAYSLRTGLGGKDLSDMYKRLMLGRLLADAIECRAAEMLVGIGPADGT